MEHSLYHLVLLLSLAWVAASVSCCEAVIDSIDICGGVPCLCRVCEEPAIVLNHFNVSDIIAIYTACGGRHIGAADAAACDVTPSSEDILPVIPLPPALPHRKQAPPPPRRRRQPAAPHRKAPAVPLPPPPTPTSGSGKGHSLMIMGVTLTVVIGGIVAVILLKMRPWRQLPQLGVYHRHSVT